MDRLMLLGKGQVLYLGGAAAVVGYMVGIGVNVNNRMNPADFFMLEISDFKNSQGYETPMTPENFVQYQATKASNKKINGMSTKSKEEDEVYQMYPPEYKNIPPPRTEASRLTQFPILFKRSFKNYFRTPSNLYGKILVLIIIPIFMCALYYNIGNDYPLDVDNFEDPLMRKYLGDVGAFIFMFTFFNFGMNLYDTVLSCNLFEM
jgi:hypothetical protein